MGRPGPVRDFFEGGRAYTSFRRRGDRDSLGPAMAIYHLHVKVIGRASGASAVAAAAYRAASRLRDDRIDRSHDFTAKRGVVHSEVLLPDGALEALSDREQLWNTVEACEVRRDAQLAREVEFALPREMSQADGIALARDFVQAEFVNRGMIADLNVHWDRIDDGLLKPHAHVMLTMRSVDEHGFGPKVREWNRTYLVERWRERWASFANQRLAELDIDARIDHRSLEAQGIALEPQDKIGASKPTAPRSIARSRVAMARESSPIRPSGSTRSRISSRPSPAATWPASHIDTATGWSNTLKCSMHCTPPPTWSRSARMRGASSASRRKA
jgi:ATP-dependent exoDNAse (exonuclease V) alpha subunit